MNRGEFIGSATAALATQHAYGINIRIGRTTSPRAPQKVTYVPSSADAIPASVLEHPIVGEARRYDGSTAPAGWVLSRGQSLSPASYSALFSVLGTIAGGDGKTTFRLPNPGVGMIVAYKGTFPASSAVVHRARPSLVGDARIVSEPKRRDAIVARAATSHVPHVAYSRTPPKPMAPMVREEIARATERARVDASAALAASTRATLTAAIAAAVRGETTLYEAVTAMETRLSVREATGVLRVNAAFREGFGSTPAQPIDPQLRLEAARFLIGVSVTREQARTISEREANSSS